MISIHNLLYNARANAELKSQVVKIAATGVRIQYKFY